MIQQRQNMIHLVVIALILYAGGVYSYLSLRFAGNWHENDTMVLTRAIKDIQAEGTLLDVTRPYGNGFSYQAISVFIAELSGIPVDDLQIYIYPLISALLPVIAFVAYREMTGSTRSALLATLFLYLQPDFLFVTWRGSHERFTWGFTLLLLYLLVRTLNLHLTRQRLAAYVVVFYFIAFGLVSTSAFFASTFTFTLALNFITLHGFFFIRRKLYPSERLDTNFLPAVNRLAVVFISMLVLLFVVFFYIYLPAGDLLAALKSLVEGISVLFLGATESVNPYSYVTGTWISTRIFLVLTSFSWVMLFGSFLIWAYSAVFYFFSKQFHESDLSRLFLWSLYPAFALQLALAVIADRANALGSNIQVRLFTPLMLAAIPIVAIGLEEMLQRLVQPTLRWAVVGLLAISIVPFSVFALLKASNEPLLSNNWLFTTESEQNAIDWVVGNSTTTVLWTGFDSRLGEYVGTTYPDFDLDLLRSGIVIPSDARYYLLSDVEMARWQRLSIPQVYVNQELLIYDNGTNKLYLRRPRTPFQ